jgi:hypothetical protein
MFALSSEHLGFKNDKNPLAIPTMASVAKANPNYLLFFVAIVVPMVVDGSCGKDTPYYILISIEFNQRLVGKNVKASVLSTWGFQNIVLRAK